MTFVAIAGPALVGLGILIMTLSLRRRGRTVPPLPEDLGYRPPGSPEAPERALPLAGLAAGALSRRRLGRKLARELPRAGIKLSPPEFAVFVLMGSAVLGLLAALIAGPVLGFGVGGAGVFVTRVFVRVRANRWLDRFEDQLPEGLDLLAGSLEAGSSLAQAMELVAAEGDPPMSEELDRVLADNRLGEPLVDALEAAADRVGSNDFSWTVRGIRIQQEFGASLASLMRTLAEFMRWRQELRREVRALTAEGRISAYVLIGLPFAVAGFFALVEPEFLGLLVTTPIGWMLTVGAAVLMTIGSIWMTRIVKVEV